MREREILIVLARCKWKRSTKHSASRNQIEFLSEGEKIWKKINYEKSKNKKYTKN